MEEMYFLKTFMIFVFEYINIFNLSKNLTLLLKTYTLSRCIINVLFFKFSYKFSYLRWKFSSKLPLSLP